MRETRRPLGSTDLSVFPVALGGTVFGMKAGTRESHRLLDAYRAGGGNFLDTSDSYRPPVQEIAGFDSESIIGSWLKTSGARDEMVIATKIRRAAEASLRRLRTDRIDLYFAHFDDQGVSLEETASAFSELVDAGMIRQARNGLWPYRSRHRSGHRAHGRRTVRGHRPARPAGLLPPDRHRRRLPQRAGRRPGSVATAASRPADGWPSTTSTCTSSTGPCPCWTATRTPGGR